MDRSKLWFDTVPVRAERRASRYVSKHERELTYHEPIYLAHS